MDVREQRARVIVAGGKITWKGGIYYVPSQSRAGCHRVQIEGVLFPTCTCADHELTNGECKHIIAARLWAEEQKANLKPAWAIEPAVQPKRKTYKQDWPNYNKAQTREKDHFLALLADLCDGIEEPKRDRAKGGRPRLPLRDVVFCAAYKVYSTPSGRRFMSDLRDAHEKGFISRTPGYNTLFDHLEDANLTPLLHETIRMSSLPLKAIEVNFAVDSSGFCTSRFRKWFDVKYGATREKAEWVKAHIMTGVLTNTVTAVEILDQHAGDGPQLPTLVEKTAVGFRIQEVSADKAYAGNPNFNAVDKAGGVLYAAFKDNATGSVGGLFEKMLCLFKLNREEYLRHYHRRSNVESTFSMVKAKFRDHVRSKTDSAMVNEVLLKFLCHNLCCLVSAIYELGIEPVFWEDTPSVVPAVLKFPGVA